MADEGTTEEAAVEQTATAASEGEESGAFAAQRARADAAEAKVAAFELQATEAANELQQARVAAMDEIVKARSIEPLKDDLLTWVQGPVTTESVEAALQAKGLNFVQAPVETIQFPEPAQVATAPQAPQLPVVQPVSTLGQQVANAASGQTAQTLDQAIAAAETPAEVARLMKEAGAAVSYT